MSKNTRRPGETVSERQVDPLATEDRFVTSMVGMSDWMKGNRDLGLIVAFLAMLGGAALVYYMDFKRDQINQAASRLESIQQSITISALEDAIEKAVTSDMKSGALVSFCVAATPFSIFGNVILYRILFRLKRNRIDILCRKTYIRCGRCDHARKPTFQYLKYAFSIVYT